MTSGQRRRNQTVHESSGALREAVLAAAGQCFETQGIDATSMEDIARQASISRRTLYRYFPNKQAVIQAVVDAQAQVFFEQMRQATPENVSGFGDRLSFYMAYAISFGPTVPGHNVLLGSRNAGITRDYYFSSPLIHGAWLSLLEDSFNKARDAGDIRADITLNELLGWAGRIIYSYVLMPDEKSVSGRMIEIFVVQALARR